MSPPLPYQIISPKLCFADIDECSFLNGGCQDICVNAIGSFRCSCRANRSLSEDGVSCKGIFLFVGSMDIFALVAACGQVKI